MKLTDEELRVLEQGLSGLYAIYPPHSVTYEKCLRLVSEVRELREAALYAMTELDKEFRLSAVDPDEYEREDPQPYTMWAKLRAALEGEKP